MLATRVADNDKRLMELLSVPRCLHHVHCSSYKECGIPAQMCFLVLRLLNQINIREGSEVFSIQKKLKKTKNTENTKINQKMDPVTIAIISIVGGVVLGVGVSFLYFLHVMMNARR